MEKARGEREFEVIRSCSGRTAYLSRLRFDRYKSFMLNVFLGAPVVGILVALASVIAEQLLAVIVNVFFQKEIVLDVYHNLSSFLVAAAIIEESFKYLSAVYILRRIFGLKGFIFIFAAVLTGLFFGLTETYFVLLANGRRIQDIGVLGGETLFSLGAVLLVHILTAFLIAVLVAVRDRETWFAALRTIVAATFIHLLFNFLVVQRGNFTNWLVGIILAVVFVINMSIVAFNFRELD